MSKEKIELKKLTHDAVFGKITKPAKGEAIATVRFYGIIDGVIDGNAQYGAYTKFHGDFEAVNLQTGEVFCAPACILPGKDDVQLLRKAFDAALAAGNPSVQFAIDYKVIPSDKGTLGYTYVGVDALKPKGIDPLLALRNALPKQLAAPRKSA